MRPTARALLVGISLNGLGALRSLAAAGVKGAAADIQPGGPAAATRFGRKFRIRSFDGPELVEDLLAIRPAFAAPPVLILTRDETVGTVAEARAVLGDAYRFVLPATPALRQVGDKASFQALAERLGLPIARMVELRPTMSARAVSDRLGGLRFPAILKPTQNDPDYLRRFPKVHRVASAAQAEQVWATVREFVPGAVVQEWIGGGDDAVYFCLQYRSKQDTLSFTGRKTLQNPPLAGNTATCIPAPEAAAALEAMCDRLFAAADCRGLCALEFKRDPASGHFLLIEPTVGRLDRQAEIAPLNGVNLPLAAWRDALGLPLPAPRAQRPTAWRDPFGQQQALRAGGRDSIADLAPGITLRDAYVRPGDPGPWLSMLRAAARERVRRLLRPGFRRAALHSDADDPSIH